MGQVGDYKTMLVAGLAGYTDALATPRGSVVVVYSHVDAVGGRDQACALRSASVDVLDEAMGWVRALLAVSLVLLQVDRAYREEGELVEERSTRAVVILKHIASSAQGGQQRRHRKESRHTHCLLRNGRRQSLYPQLRAERERATAKAIIYNAAGTAQPAMYKSRRKGMTESTSKDKERGLHLNAGTKQSMVFVRHEHS